MSSLMDHLWFPDNKFFFSIAQIISYEDDTHLALIETRDMTKD